jgi:hypothetical protein
MGDGQTTILTSFAEKTGWRQISGPLFRKYVGLFLAVVCVACSAMVFSRSSFPIANTRMRWSAFSMSRRKAPLKILATSLRRSRTRWAGRPS